MDWDDSKHSMKEASSALSLRIGILPLVQQRRRAPVNKPRRQASAKGSLTLIRGKEGKAPEHTCRSLLQASPLIIVVSFFTRLAARR